MNDIELVIRTILIIYVIDLQPDYRLLFINKDLGVNYMNVYKQFVFEHFSEIRTNEQVQNTKIFHFALLAKFIYGLWKLVESYFQTICLC